MSETTKVGHVYTALFTILKAMSVDKGGVLPSNMGGKPYITAVDLNAEAKRQFVDNDLILIPNERETHKEIISVSGGGFKITLSIEGTYTIYSTKDGSSVTISGVGDGVAAGTAVAANIASTNALKNALLRTFLVTEQSVEDAAKNGTPEAEERKTPATQRVEAAKGIVREATGAGDNEWVAAIKKIVSSGGTADGVALSGSEVTAVAKRLHGDDKGAWKQNIGKSQQVHDAIVAGERK